ncbi:putative nucleoredoxin 3, partial [Mucuna pruriens]
MQHLKAVLNGQDFEAKIVDTHNILKIFAAEGVEFLLSYEGKVHVSELRPLFTDACNNLKAAKDHCFEIVLVSTDRDLKEFNVLIRIPSLVLIGSDGKVISMKGKFMVSSYGVEAFPFTEARIRDLEAALRKERGGGCEA